MEEKELFRYLLNHSLEVIFTFDEHGIINEANDAAKKFLEYGEDLCGSPVSAIFPNEFQIENGQLIRHCPLGDTTFELMAYRKNQTFFPARVRILRYEGKPIRYICFLQDVLEQNFFEKRANQASQEVEAAQKVKSEFVANVTHELRTPVNGILGNTKELIEKEADKDKLNLLHMIERSCNDMHALINNILDFSKLEAGKFTLEQREFNFRKMIDYVKANHINKITEKGLDFFVTISPEVPEQVIGDELRIVQILNNLLSNACKFTAVGKIILEVVKTAQIDNRVELFFLVIDTGIGIDKANQDKLFLSFSQVDASISRRYGGTGLGLNICKQLVELMNGAISVESELGQGSMFSFHIWVEIPTSELEASAPVTQMHSEAPTYMSFSDIKDQKIMKFGSSENMEELRKKMSKLILSVEMDNWEKAEMFAETIRELIAEAPSEIKSASLRLKMAVQKGDYDKTQAAYEKLQSLLSDV